MQNSIFNIALNFILQAEGGYVNNPNDLGGETNCGITKNVYDAFRKSKSLPCQSVKLISKNEIEEIYYKKYFLPAGAHKIENPKLAVVHFDTAVNMGIKRANSFLTLSKGNLDYYINLRKQKYIEFAKVPSQSIFLQGWLNRINRLNCFINKNF